MTKSTDSPTLNRQIWDAIILLWENEPIAGYKGCFSGGKDSSAIKHLAEMAQVKVEWHYHKTTIDPPELVQFIKREHPNVIWDRPKYGNFFNRMKKKGFPTRRNRWCCSEYKEGSFSKESTLIMGIRAEESVARSKRWGEKSTHFRSGATVINPIFHWASDELWDFVQGYNIPYCSLYNEGFKRLGCIGCPNAGQKRIHEFKRWPKIEQKWKDSFKAIWDRRTGSTQKNGKIWFGNAYFDEWEAMWDWWISDARLPNRKDREQ